MPNVKALLPKPVLSALRTLKYGATLVSYYLYDLRRTWKWTSAVVCDTDKKLRALIVMGYHSIEKGLSLERPRPGFGRDNAELLVSRVEEYQAMNGGSLDSHAQIALSALRAYCEFNEKNGVNSHSISSAVERISQRAGNGGSRFVPGGVSHVRKDELLSKSKIDLEPFLNSRHSVRAFGSESVSLETLRTAVRLAQKSPSVCNRQSSRFWVWTQREQIDSILEFHGGARGFGDQADKLIAVTADLSHFQSCGERNQFYIDGGMAAMTLMYALHSLGLVTCPLVWGQEPKRERKMRKLTGIGDPETIIMFLAVGCPRDEFRVAQSTRKALEEVLEIR